MKTTHTPGPWHVIDHALPGINYEDRMIVDDCGNRIALVRGDGVAASIREANARIIAAAPDLLEACEAALCVHDVFSTATTPRLLPEVADILRAAIAKAKGNA